MYNGKNKIFDSFCWHYDDTELLPPKANILASNDTARLYENVTLNNKKGSILQADSIDYDFQRKKYKVSMNSESEKVKIKFIK